MKSSVLKVVIALLLMALLGGCAAHRTAFKKGEELARKGDYEAAVPKYAAASAARPERNEYRMRLYQARNLASLSNLNQGRMLAQKGDTHGAVAAYSRAVALDPTNEAAAQELQRLSRGRKGAELVETAQGFLVTRNDSQARNVLRQALQLDPANDRAAQLLREIESRARSPLDGHDIELASDKPITLKFKDADIREVFGILSQLSGINFVYDADIRSQRVSIFLEDATFAQALEFLLQMNNLGKKVLNSRTIIIYPRTREKDKKYEDQIIRTFFLSNIDGKRAVNLLRTMLKLQKIYVHEELNAIVVRDTSEVIRLVEQILEVADRADAEVVFDLELIEVSHSDDLNFGPKLSTYSISLGMGKGPGATNIVSSTLAPGASTDNLLTSLSGLETFYTLPTATFDFLKTLTNAEVLAHPSIRVKNREKAKVHIGTREPVVTVTFTGVGDTRTDSVQYVDVGVKLDIEPTIQLDNTVVTRLNLEVSSVSGRQTTQTGTQVLTITTTNAQTALTLRNGERTIIGGLIRDDYAKSSNTIPGIGSIPFLGNLFTSQTRRKAKREILLSVTPHIIKNLELPDPETANIWSGAEDDLRAGPSFGSFAVAVAEATPQNRPSIPPEPEVPASPLPPVLAPAPVEASQPETAPSAPPETGIPLVYFSGPSRVAVGEEFVMTLHAADMLHLLSAPFSFTYDPERLEFVQVREGTFLKQDGVPTIFTNSADGGRVLIGYRQAGAGEGASGEGDLLQIAFRAKSPGGVELVPAGLNFRDRDGKRVPVEFSTASIEVH
jgi:general secretion pathway protein D